MVSVVDGVEQLETYFGQFLPQVVIALMTPIVIFAFVAFFGPTGCLCAGGSGFSHADCPEYFSTL